MISSVISHLHSSLQFDLLLLLLVELHYFDLVLLEYSTLLDVELLLGLRIDLFGFLAGLLLDEGHHMLDLDDPNKFIVQYECRSLPVHVVASIVCRLRSRRRKDEN